METYKYPKSKELFLRATKSIPGGVYGHLGPSEACMTPIEAYPFYSSKAKGAYFWDLDGNRFIDYMCAYGPNVLGYNDPDVDKAAKEQLELGNCVTLPSTKMVEFAELLVDTVSSADWAFFAKNGGDVTNLAMLTARAATGREIIVKFVGGYHGVQPWMLNEGYPGVIQPDVKNVITIPFNRPELFAEVIRQHPGKIAGLISTPYSHPALAPSEMPKEGFWKEIRKLCTDNGIVLIIDDVRCGFRIDTKGSDHHFGFEADLICFCKALANGYNVSALCGKDSLKSAVGSVFYTGSYWLSSVPFAAGVACIKKLREIDGAKLMNEKGKKMTDGLVKLGKEKGFDFEVTGMHSMFFMHINNDHAGLIHQEWVGEMVKRGIFMSNHHNQFINCALSDEDIQHTWDVAEEAFDVVKKNHPEI